MFLRTSILFLLLILSANGYSQTNIWYKLFGPPETVEWGKRVIQTPDKGFIILVSKGDYVDINTTYLLKTDSIGNLQWYNHLGDTIRKHTVDIALTNDSGFVVIGDSYGNFMIKMDKNGNFVWKRYYTTFPMYLWRVIPYNDGGFLLCGWNTYYSPPSGKGFVIRTNSLGIPIWEREYSDSLFNSIGDIAVDDNGCIYTAGLTQKIYPTVSYRTVKKLTPNGDVIWTKIYDYIHAAGDRINILNDGKLLVGGIDDYAGNLLILTKIDTSGNILWQRNHPGFVSLGLFNIDSNNNMITSSVAYWGYSNSSILKFDSAGNLTKVKTLQSIGVQNLDISNCELLNDNSLILTGSTHNWIPLPNTNYDDVLLMKIDSSFNAPVVIDVKEPSQYVPNDFNILSSYPNPFNSTFNVKFRIHKNGLVNKTIFDVRGRSVFSENKFYNAGLNEFRINFEQLGLSSGVYFVRLNYESNYKLVKAVYLK